MAKRSFATARGSLLHIIHADGATNTCYVVQLHESSHPDEIVAWFSKSCMGHGNHVLHAAHLAIKPEMVQVRDVIVLSCLLAEHKLRVLDVLSAAQSKVAMHSVMF